MSHSDIFTIVSSYQWILVTYDPQSNLARKTYCYLQNLRGVYYKQNYTNIQILEKFTCGYKVYDKCY